MSDGIRPGPDDKHPFWRTDEQVMASARRMAAAVEAGMPADTLHTLLAARRAWWAEGREEEPDWPDSYSLGIVLADERSEAVEPMLYAAIRRRVRTVTGLAKRQGRML